MYINLPYSTCTGCTACSEICSKDAITMQLDENGFYKPVINMDLCVGCGACERICPVNNPLYTNLSKPMTYAYCAADEVRARSSSGGVFEELAKYVLSENGVVCGVAYKEDFTTEHIMIEKLDDLAKLRGSKYVMSDMGNIFRTLREQLNAERMVLFTGVPCQIAGLNAYLGKRKDDENLLTVDLICHGIPSVKAFKKYIADLHSHKQIKYIGYKEKQYGWHASMTIDFEDGDRYNMPCEKDPYFWSYLSGVNKNACCGDCKFARIPRQGDITIGDYWGISKYKEKLNDGKGTSVVLINSIKGEKYFEKIKNKAKLIEETPLEPAIAGNSNLITSPKIHVSRNQFFKNLSSRRYGELAKWAYSAERFDVGLVGIPIYVNFGGALTYYALYRVLEDNGLKTLMISRPRSCGRPPIMPELIYESSPYAPNVLKLTLADKEEMRSMNQVCEAFLVGSDQLFNADLYYRFGEMITLDWVSDNHRKVAYAASFGHSVFWGKEELRAKMAHDMQKFDAFSVREEDGVELAKREFGVEAKLVLDPVFLCQKEHYAALSEKAARKNNHPHLFAYILDGKEEKNRILEYCSKEKGLEVELFSEMLFKPTKEKLKSEQKKFTFPLRQARIEERLYSLIHSDFIVTDSFHGVCFAIIFEIPFVAILNKNRGATRFYTILKKLGLMDRLITNMEEAQEKINQEVDFTIPRKILQEEKEKCIGWLLDSIAPQNTMKKSYSSDDMTRFGFDIQNKKLGQMEMKINALINGKMYCKEKNIYRYMEMLRQYKEELIIAVAVRDTPGFEINKNIDNLIRQIGGNISLVNKHWQSYVLILDGGVPVFEQISKNQERVAYAGTIQGRSYRVVSRSYHKGDISVIQVDGKDYSENKRGLNIVLVDKNLNEVIDTVAFDTHEKSLSCYRSGRKYIEIEERESADTKASSASALKRVIGIFTKRLNRSISYKNKHSEEKKAEALPSITAVEPKSGILEEPAVRKGNELVLHNAFVVAALGGSVLDYYADKGISEIIIYGSDCLAAYVYEQAYYKEIKVKKIFSDKNRKFDIKFPRPGQIEGEDIRLINIRTIDVPVIVADEVCPKKLLELKEKGKKVNYFRELNMYAHIKRALLDPVLEYKKQYPGLRLALFKLSGVNEIKNPTEYEILLRKALFAEAMPVRKEILSKLGYDKEYEREVMKKIDVTNRNGIDVLSDIRGKYVNVVNGYRVTTDIPSEFSHTIYVFGNSVCYGVGTHDEYTICSVLQRECNIYNKNFSYAVLNCANGAGMNAKQQWKSFAYHRPQNKDIAVFLMDGFNDLIRENYCNDFLWCNAGEVLDRPHNWGEVFLDANHLTSKGYEACGKYFAQKLLENSSLDMALNKNPRMNRKENAKEALLNSQEEKELEKYLDSISVYKRKNVAGVTGAIVMNCNPFTLGHRYLIEHAAQKCSTLYIFVVEEDKSIFSFEDRIELVRKGTDDLTNVVVIPSGKFIISQLTFDAYFQKEENNDVEIDPTNDVTIFAAKIAPFMGITKRFAGDEPLDKVTNQYNSTMRRILPQYGMEFEVIRRKEEDGEVISASGVRRLLQNKEFEAIKRIVPGTTYEYLYEKYKDSKRVLVWGGTRFMGIRLVEHIIKKNWFVTIATRGIHKDGFGKSVSRIKVDRKSEEQIEEAFREREFDFVFDNIAYQGMDVKRLLPHTKCKQYIQVSSVAAYKKHHLGLKEDELDTGRETYELRDDEPNYGIAKRAAECVALQQFSHIPTTIVRIPFVVEPDNLENKELNMRLFFYVKHIMEKIPMQIDNFEYSCSFVRTGEEADFLIYLAENNLAGVYNFSSGNSITVGEIIRYIEEKSGIKAVYSEKGDLHPFAERHFQKGKEGYSFDLSKAERTGFGISDVKDWLFPLLDHYIGMFK